MPDLRRMFDYDRWANREALASLSASASPLPRGLKLMGHIVAAEALWHARLTGRDPELSVWPDLSAAQCEIWLADLERSWNRYLERAVPAELGNCVAYTNTKGESFTSTVEDVLTHVVMHSAYHRGQIAADVRASGHQPAYTDFIHAARAGHIP